MSYELYETPRHIDERWNPVNGRFIKGHVPFNKGKTWDELKIKKRSRKRMAKGWQNLVTHRPTARPDNAGRCRKPIIAVMDDGKWIYFPYVGKAAEVLGGNRENIGRCCRSNQARHRNQKTGKVNTDHRYNGIRFYFEEDDVWLDKI